MSCCIAGLLCCGRTNHALISAGLNVSTLRHNGISGIIPFVVRMVFSIFGENASCIIALIVGCFGAGLSWAFQHHFLLQYFQLLLETLMELLKCTTSHPVKFLRVVMILDHHI